LKVSGELKTQDFCLTTPQRIIGLLRIFKTIVSVSHTIVQFVTASISLGNPHPLSLLIDDTFDSR